MQVRAIQNCLNQTDLQPTQRPLRALQQRVRRGQRSRWLTLSTVQACEQADNSIQIRASGPATVRWSERGDRAEQAKLHCQGPKAPNDTGRHEGPG